MSLKDSVTVNPETVMGDYYKLLCEPCRAKVTAIAERMTRDANKSILATHLTLIKVTMSYRQELHKSLCHACQRAIARKVRR